jgi:tripartite-type tricarboxylate transporter receptor subunit TctC
MLSDDFFIPTPQSTPDKLVIRFNHSLAAALKSPDVVERLLKTDQVVVASTPTETVTQLAAKSLTWGTVTRRIKLGLD